MISVYVMRKMRRLTLPNIFTSMRVFMGFSVPLWWQEGTVLTYTMLGMAVLTAWVAWVSEFDHRQVAPLSRALCPLADKFFILPIFWFVGVTTLDWGLLVLAGYTTFYDIVTTWQRRVALSLAWQGVTLLYLPTTALSRTKTVCQYLLVLLIAVPGLELYATIMMIVTMVMTVVSWASHRNFMVT